ncbi:MAG: transcription-repair coupling factor [Syntrophotaleaceae bacterium]
MEHNLHDTEILHATVHSFVSGRPADHSEVYGLIGSSGAFLLSNLLTQREDLLLILAPDQKQGRQFAADLAFYHGRPEEIHFFPHWDVGPYQALTPHPDVEADRLKTLAALRVGKAKAVVLTVRSLMQRVIPRNVLDRLCRRLIAGGEFPRDDLLRQLVSLGYQAVPLVEDQGTFSVRGDILDIYPPNQPAAVRIEFFGDQIERIRPFDTASQRSTDTPLKTLELLPAREMILAGECLDTFARCLKQRCDALDIARPQREAVLEEARDGILSPGHSFLMPLNYDGLDSFFDYSGQGHWIVLDPPAVEEAIDRFSAEIREGERRMADKGEIHVAAADLFLDPATIEQELSRQPRTDFASLEVFRIDEERPHFRFQVNGNGDLREGGEDAAGSLAAQLANRLRDWRRQDWRVLLVCHQQGQADRLRDLVEPHGLSLTLVPGLRPSDLNPGQVALTLGELSAGFRLPDERLAVIGEEEIFGRRTHRRGVSEARARAMLSSLAELREGDYIVHADQGIGLYRGLLHLRAGETEGDFLHLEYAGEDKLYLPVERIEKVQKYVGGEGHAPRLDRMGGGAWEKAKVRARMVVEELARDLLNIYARREMGEAFAYSPPDNLFREFEAAFPYEETPDQLVAINESLADMQSARPMDRLVCGDVGYGKTEVAIRAAFKAVLDSKQVAVLVPTTVLARQHLQTFSERFQGYPVTVDMMSRFRTAAEQKETLRKTAEGKVDILIGTHRLLQRDVRFKDLGLVIVDEEQRFGVTHKERLKKLRAEVDMLTLTATPIPRTLHMSLLGLRNLSVIDTPPVDRQAIRTYVTRFDDDLIRQAILRELQRGGQVFFVHNRVQSIEGMAGFLRTLVPEAKIAVGHGQMGEKALEDVMMDFIEGRSNVLVCSTIIENGLDIPRANTIIINRADCFGLAQLYQLRGRVGRSHQRAYAYLLIPGEGTLTRDARERLRVLQELTELGAGFRIASHDLELRGAGDLLGAKQSGQIAAIGFEMYAELLEETILELKGQHKEERIDPEIRLGLSAFLPEKYLPDPNQRLVFYKKLAAAVDDRVIYETADELRDRYGELPPPAMLLLEVMKLRVLMKRLRIELAEYDGHNLIFGFRADTPVTPDQILGLMRAQDGRYRFTPDYRLTVRSGRLAGEGVLETAKKELHGFLQL